MDDQSDQPLADDLSFLDALDLDRGLDLDLDLDRVTPPAVIREPVRMPAGVQGRPIAAGSRRPRPQIAHPERHADRDELHRPRRRRPLLELFPPSEVDAAAPPPISTRPLPPTLAATDRPARAGHSRPRPVARGVRPTYEIFYGLNEKPFSLTSDPRFLYHSTGHDRAAHEMLGAIERRAGCVILTGEAGSGKTTLCRLVIDELDGRTFTSLVLDSFVTIEALLKTVLIDFGVISHADLASGRLLAASQHELTIALKEFLLSLVPLGAFALIFVDDAQNLSAETLEQVRGLSALEPDQQLIQLVLVGEPSLLARLDRTGRVAPRETVRCELGPLTADEIDGYVIRRLAVSGDGPSRVEFDTEAFTKIYEFSRGLPRLVNRICDRTLTLGYEQSASVIDAALVETAANDLDLVPPEPASARAWRFSVAAAALVGLMLIGATAATLVFNTRVQRAVAAWQALPSVPASPPPRMVRPVARVPVPADGSPDSGAAAPRRTAGQ